jgi:hypothetical protein
MMTNMDWFIPHVVLVFGNHLENLEECDTPNLAWSLITL